MIDILQDFLMLGRLFATLSLLVGLIWSPLGYSIPCKQILSPSREESLRHIKIGLLGNRDYLEKNWGQNVVYFENRPTDFFTILVPELKKATNLFDLSIEESISNLEFKFRTLVTNQKRLESVQAFAIRGIKPNDTSDRVDYQRVLEEKGYISEHGGNFFIFHPRRGGFAAKMEPGVLAADRFLSKLYASCGSIKGYAHGGDGLWGGPKLSAVVLVRFTEDFSLRINKGNDGIDGSYPYSFATFGKVFHLSNLDVGNINRRKYPNGIPSENIEALILSIDLPPSLKRGKSDSLHLSQMKEIAQTRWLYLQILGELTKILELTTQ